MSGREKKWGPETALFRQALPASAKGAQLSAAGVVVSLAARRLAESRLALGAKVLARAGVRRLQPGRTVDIGTRVVGASSLAVFVRLPNIPGEAEFSRFCACLAERDNTFVSMPQRWTPRPGQRRESVLSQLAFIAQTFGIPAIWPYLEGDSIEAITRARCAINVQGELLLNENFFSKIVEAGVPVIVSLSGSEPIAEILGRLQTISAPENRFVLKIATFDHSGRPQPAFSIAGLLYALRRLSSLPVIVDCGSQDQTYCVEELALPAIGSGADGLMLDVHWCAATPSNDIRSVSLERFAEIWESLTRVKQSLLAIESLRERGK